jgi:hypothetical protein
MSNGDFKTEVVFGVDTAEFQAGLNQITAQLQEGMEKMKGSLNSMSSGTKGAAREMTGSLGSVRESLNSVGGAAAAVVPELGKIAAEFGPIIAAAALLKCSVSFTQEWAGEVLRLSTMLGISTQEASALDVALGELAAEALRSDVSVESLYHLIQMFTRSLGQNEEMLNKVGIATREGPNKDYRNMLDIMLDVLKYLNSLDGATARNVASQKIFHRSWQDVIVLLGLTPAKMEEARKKADDLGLTLGQDGVMHARAFQKSCHELHLQWEGFKNFVGGPLVDALSTLFEWINKDIKAAHEMKDFESGVRASLGDWRTGATKTRMPKGMVFMGGEIEEERRPGGGKPPEELLEGKGGAGAGGPGLLAQWRDELEQIKAAEGSFFDFSKEREKAFWEAKLSLCQEGSAEWLGVRRLMYEADKAIAAEELAQAKETEESKAKLAEITVDKKKALALIDLEIAKDTNAHLRAMDEIDKAEEYRRQQELETKKYAIELTALKDKEKIELDKIKAEIEAGTKSALELQKLEDKKREIVAKEAAQEEELQKKHQATMLNLQQKEQEQEKSNWQDTLNKIGSSFNNLIGQLASGNKQMLSAFKSFCDSMVKTFMDAVEQMIMEWMGFQSMMDATKWAFGGIGAIFGFQAGAWNIPHTMPAVLHPGEMVLPAPAAAAFRSAAVGGSAGFQPVPSGGPGAAPPQSFHFHISALDGADVQRVLLNNPDAVAAALRSLGHNFVPVGR